MKDMKTKRTILMLLLSFVLLLASCGGAGGNKSDYRPDTEHVSYREDSALDNNGYYKEETGPASDDMNDDNVSSSIIVNTTSEKLVYTCRITMETTEFKKTAAAVRGLIEKYGGFIQEDTISDNDNDWYYENYRKTGASLDEYIVIRIPTENYTAFLNDLDGEGKIRSKQQKVQNITRAYNDTEITIESLKTQEERLLEMLKEADTVEDMIYIEQRLSEVQNDLKIQTSYLSGMDTDIAYSTITLDIKEVLEYTKDAAPVKTSTFKDRLKNTIKYSWENFLLFTEDLLFFLIKALPILLLLGVIVVVIVLIVRKAIKNPGKKKKDDTPKKDAFIVQKKEETKTEE